MRVALAFGAVAVTCLAMPIAQAQGEQGADGSKARELFDEALAYIDAGRYPEAVSRLERSLELSAEPATAYNLVVALLGSGDVMRARELLDQLEAERFGELPPERAAALQELRQDAREQVATLQIRVTGPPEAEVHVDGSPGRAVAPGQRIEIEANPGRRRIVASARDYQTVVRTVTLEPGATRSLELTLARAQDTRPSRVILEADDRDATVEVEDVGRAAARFERDLPPGQYRVRVRLDDEVSKSTVDVPAGRRLRMTVAAPSSATVWTSPWLWSAVGVVVAAGTFVGVFFATRPEDPVGVPSGNMFRALTEEHAAP